MSVFGITRSKEVKSSRGVKDKYQEYFLARVYNFHSDLRGQGSTLAEKEKKLSEYAKTIPEKRTNPVWEINGELFILKKISCVFTGF